MRRLEITIAAIAVVLASCAAEPVRYGEIVTLRAGQPAPETEYPPAGTVWRLDANDLMTLSPAPVVPAPPPPTLPPPPRPNEPYPRYYDAFPYWGPGYGHHWRRW